MDTLTKSRKTVKQTDFKTFSHKVVLRFPNEHSCNIVAMTQGWQCCKCRETMYRDEDYCNYDKCRHSRCNSCRSFQV